MDFLGWLKLLFGPGGKTLVLLWCEAHGGFSAGPPCVERTAFSPVRGRPVRAGERPPFPLERRSPGLLLGPCVSVSMLSVTHFVRGNVRVRH